MKTDGKKIFSGALILGAGAFIAKFLGAVYRIPLTKIIGGTGLGLYQMVFPVYTLLLDISGAGVPNAVAKLISSYAGYDKEIYARKILRVSLAFFSALGALLSILTAAFSEVFSVAQGNPDASLAYLFLSPSVFSVCVICCFRGYFQGRMNMTPTAVSQIIEQTVKLALGLVAARLLMPDVAKAVAGATFAITVSEVVALMFLAILYAVKRRKGETLKIRLKKADFSASLKDIFVYAVPITLTGMILPLSKVADSFLIINLLNYEQNATGLYGLFSGVAVTVIGLPVAVCYGISVVAVPAVASSGAADKGKNALKTVLMTVAVAVPCSVFCAVFAPLIIDILFGYLSAADKAVSVNLLRLVSPCVTLLSLLQTANGVLIGKGNPKKPMAGMAAGVAVKIIVEIFTLKNPSIGIYGAAIASIACYFVADLVNLSLIFPFGVKKKENERPRVKIEGYAD